MTAPIWAETRNSRRVGATGRALEPEDFPKLLPSLELTAAPFELHAYQSMTGRARLAVTEVRGGHLEICPLHSVGRHPDGAFRVAGLRILAWPVTSRRECLSSEGRTNFCHLV